MFDDEGDQDVPFFAPPTRKAHTQSATGPRAIVNDIAALQNALSAGLAGASPFAHAARTQMPVKRQAFGLESPTRRRQQAAEAPANLSDPVILARLTRNMKHSPQSSPRFQPNGLG